MASTGGAIYAAIVAAIISRGQIGMMEIVWVVLISIIVSLPVLVAGSAAIGWWVSKFLARRVRTNRLLVFAMAGMLMGLIVDMILLVFSIRFLGLSMRDIPRSVDEVINAALVASIPLFCLTMAGLIAGAHITHIRISSTRASHDRLNPHKIGSGRVFYTRRSDYFRH